MNVRTLPATLHWRVPRTNWIALAGWGVLMIYVGMRFHLPHLGDAWAYWKADLGNLYDGSGIGVLSYVYPPPLAQLLEPFRALPYPVFLAGLTALEAGALAYLIGPAWAAIAITVGPMNFTDELINANINLLVGVAVVFALRRPAWWAVPIITKVTPGIALVYHVARREWREVAVALGVTGAIVAVSFAIAPSAWTEWWSFTIGGVGQMGGELDPYMLIAPLWLRLPAAAGIAWWAGATGRTWPIPIAVAMALPYPRAAHWSLAIAAIPLALDDLRSGREKLPTTARSAGLSPEGSRDR